MKRKQLHIITHLKLMSLTLLFSLVAACGGGSSDSGQTDSIGETGNSEASTDNDDEASNTQEKTSKLKFTFINNLVSRQPVSGVLVSVYKPDDVTIDRTIITGNNGVADFDQAAGESGAITVTYAYEQQFTSPDQVRRTIITVLDMPGGDYIFTIPQELCDVKASNVSVSFNGENAGGNRFGYYPAPDFDPLTTSQDIDAGASKIDGDLCARDIQDDGKYSTVAIANNRDVKITSYGYLVDQDSNDNAQYTGVFDHTPSELFWQSVRGSRSTTLTGYRKGVSHFLGGFNDPQLEEQTEGNFKIAGDFPAEYFILTGLRSSLTLTNQDFSIFESTQKRLNSLLSEPVELSFPDLFVESLLFSNSEKRVSWQLGENEEVDLVNWGIAFTARGEQITATVIDVVSRPDRGQFNLPDLPSEIAAWRDSVLNAATEHTLTIQQSSVYDGFDELILISTEPSRDRFSQVTLGSSYRKTFPLP